MEYLRLVFEMAALLAAALGLPIAAYQLYVGRKEAQAGRDLHVVLSLSESFRSNWDGRWASALVAAESDANLDPVQDAALQSMLNWVDWLGTLTAHGHLADSGAMLDTLTPPIKRLLEVERARLASDIGREGCEYWAGVLRIARIVWPDYEHQICPSASDV